MAKKKKTWLNYLALSSAYERKARLLPALTSFLERPKPCHPELDDEEFAALLLSRVQRRERRIRDRFARKEKTFMGAKAVKAQSIYDSTNKPYERRGKISPTIACSDQWKRIAALAENDRWHEQYRYALAEYRAGDHGVEFPYGTVQRSIAST